MGSPISPLLAEIFMALMEYLIFSSNNVIKSHVFYWTGYVDDIFCLWTGTERNLSNFLTFLNSFNIKIQFTMETEENGQLNFLDINIKIHSNLIKFNIYRKPTTTDTVIHFNSQQSWQIKLSPFHSPIHRLTNFPLNNNDYNTELNIIKQIAKNNGYNESLIDDNMVKNKQRKMLRKTFFNVLRKPANYKFINYIPNVSNKISNRLNILGTSTISINKVNLRRILIINKEKINKLNQSGVYEIQCKDCNAVCIG